MESSTPDPNPAKKPVPVRPPSLRYLGFVCTSVGRAYQVRVEGAGDPRVVTLTIPNGAFEARQARFQDAPDLCFARLQRELAANAELPDGLELVITPTELDEYRDAQLRKSPDRKTRTLRTWP
jgi:hypothetical protein